MDLFIVNRYLDVEIPKDDDEQTKLQATLNKIEANRAKREKRRALLSKRQELKWKIIARRRHDNELKFKSPGENQFIDEELNKFAEKLDEQDLNFTNGIIGNEVSGPNESEIINKKLKRKRNDEAVDGFTILGTNDLKHKAKVKRVLPGWLAKPTVISVDLKNLHTKVSAIKSLNKQLRLKLKEENVKYFFPVQAAVIPYLLNSNSMRHCMAPRDICVSAPTGSGKTLAFVLPVIQALLSKFVKRIRALIILPTQDLASQVFATFKKYTEGTKLDVLLITGGTHFMQEQEQLVTYNAAFGYTSKVDILVGTAGRLVDHIKKTTGFTLEYLEFLVVDEADRVLDNVQNDWLYHLEKHIYKNVPTDLQVLNLSNYRSRRAPQKLLFSATLSQDPEKLHKLALFQPKLFTSIIEGENTDIADISAHFIGKYTIPKELTEKYVITSLVLKPLVLYQFIKNEKLTKALVFTDSLNSTHRLKVLLQTMFNTERKVEEIGSNLDVQSRNKLIQNFSNGEIDILICTDALARGIDLPGVQCVVSYSAPKHLKTYIHRAGRTARAGEQGLTVTMLMQQQLAKFNAMLLQGEKKILEEIKINEEGLEHLGEQYKEALSLLKSRIHSEDIDKIKKLSSAKRQAVKSKRPKKA